MTGFSHLRKLIALMLLERFSESVCFKQAQLDSSLVVPFPSHIVYKNPGTNVPVKFKADKFVMWVGNKWLQTNHSFIS